MTDIKTDLIQTKCAICDTDTYDRDLYPANFDPAVLTAEIFSARRMPDRLHYRIVRCQNCGLVRSNPILNEGTLGRLYAHSFFTYAKESIYAAQTYLAYFKKILGCIPCTKKEIRLLEIGCGNGFFLKAVHSLGIQEVCGVEPSEDAVSQAGEFSRHIHCGMFGRDIYPQEYFNIICAFQIFDHISQPNDFLATCMKYLKKGGTAFFINHDIGSFPARILGRHCPMIDIEHTFLYDKVTFPRIFLKNKFEVLKVFSVANRYPFSYWLKLAPVSISFKNGLLREISKSRIGNLSLTLRLGNMGILARRLR